MDEERAFRYAKQIACAMAYLHKQGEMHCNLKASNVLVRISFIKLNIDE